jgi:hypothetical protein
MRELKSAGQTKMRDVALVSATLAVVGVSLLIGDSLGKRTILGHMKVSLDEVQAMLVADRIHEERQLQTFLERGCTTAAIQRIKVREYFDMKLLAEFIDGSIDAGTRDYIGNRNPGLLDELKVFKSKYPNISDDVTCEKIDAK